MLLRSHTDIKYAFSATSAVGSVQNLLRPKYSGEKSYSSLTRAVSNVRPSELTRGYTMSDVGKDDEGKKKIKKTRKRKVKMVPSGRSARLTGKDDLK